MSAKPSAESAAVDAPFWEGLAANELRMPRCAQCEKWAWPPQWRCGACGAWEQRWEAIPMRGKVFSFARTRHAFTPDMQGKTPFVTLLVELPDADGARLIGMLVDGEEGLQIGAAVEGFVEAGGPGELPALRWRLSKKGGTQ